ncbi:unnamed protein product [Prorocentrum cordatum]|uniref:Uncharacterized protein n=1 Tax=Prorocentrum cordatum TaxID=2364126 RepID=A0ABN9SIB0_9DINO|nr:unnamed protein product [Polarella glacialis]
MHGISLTRHEWSSAARQILPACDARRCIATMPTTDGVKSVRTRIGSGMSSYRRISESNGQDQSTNRPPTMCLPCSNVPSVEVHARLKAKVVGGAGAQLHAGHVAVPITPTPIPRPAPSHQGTTTGCRTALRGCRE